MTREEAINELKYEWDYMLEGTGIKGREKEEAERNEDFRKIYQANMMAIEALEEPEIGKWEYIQYDADPSIGNWYCSKCRHIISMNIVPYYRYCPYCGQKKEREDE